MRRRIQKRLEKPQEGNDAQAAGVTVTGKKLDELEQVNALYSLLEDRYMKKVSH